MNSLLDLSRLYPEKHPYTRGTHRNNNGSDDEEEDTPEPNYVCKICDMPSYIDDHKKRAPSFCETCETVRTFMPIED